MKVKVSGESLVSFVADAVVVTAFEGVAALDGAAEAIDKASNGLISSVMASGEFKAKLNEVIVLYPMGLHLRKIVVVGLGKAEKLDVESLRQAGASGVKAAVRGKVSTVATGLHGVSTQGIRVEDAVAAFTEGAILGTYTYEAMKSKPEDRGPVELVVVDDDANRAPCVEKGVERGRALAEATNLARDLVNAPANHMTPTHMAATATKIAAEAGLSCEILEQGDMERLGMGALLGVAKGSMEPPKLIVLRYEGNPGQETLAIVGKGITFDSGGISIKPAEGMHLMKDDMAGGAAVLGAMQAIGRLKPKVNVLGIVAATENMPAGNALKPGDVITAMTGKTIEIISTDAEGRLILADAVAYAVKLGATKVVDIATLTGACGVALGHVYSALLSNCDVLATELKNAADLSGERFWPMPNHDEYREMIKSPVADIKNSGGRLGGVMTGGLFIGEFVSGKPWVHLDIAPTAYVETEKHYQPKGATGVATRTLIYMALSHRDGGNATHP